MGCRQVGAMDCDNAGAPSDLIKVVAEPLTADRPTEADGFALAGIATAPRKFHHPRKNVVVLLGHASSASSNAPSPD